MYEKLRKQFMDRTFNELELQMFALSQNASYGRHYRQVIINNVNLGETATILLSNDYEKENLHIISVRFNEKWQ